MRDAIAKAKGPVFSTSRNWQNAYKRNTIKARRQDGRRVCERLQEDSIWEDEVVLGILFALPSKD